MGIFQVFRFQQNRNWTIEKMKLLFEILVDIVDN